MTTYVGRTISLRIHRGACFEPTRLATEVATPAQWAPLVATSAELDQDAIMVECVSTGSPIKRQFNSGFQDG